MKSFCRLQSKWLCVATGSGLIALYQILKSKERPLEASSYLAPFQQKWDSNWDKRELSSLVKPCKHKSNLSDEVDMEVEKMKLLPTATRHILLIRHGQYYLSGEDDKDRKLTPLGLKQAALVGQRLKDLKLDVSKLVHSTMTRAEETASVILKYLPNDIPVEKSDLLREGSPIPVEPPVGSWREEFKYYTDNPRIEGAFRQHFHRASCQQKSDSIEIIVCHANVIRYFVCRLLQVPPEAWLRFSLHNCSITWTTIYPNGNVAVNAIGECGFIPTDTLTRT